jgi:hypothetical protein
MMEDLETSQKTPPPPMPAESPPIFPKSPSRFQKFLRTALLSLGGALVLFLAGLIVGYVWLTRPAQAEVQRLTAELSDEKTASQERIAELEGQVENLTAVETKGAAIQQELEEARLQLAVLNTLTDVMAARIELAAKNEAGMRLALNNVAKSLTTLAGLAPADQKEALQAMQDHLELVLEELENNPASADQDLDVLEQNLLQLLASLKQN